VGVVFVLSGISQWKLREVAELSPAGGVVWLNLEPGGAGTGGAGGVGAPEKGDQDEAALPGEPQEKKEKKQASVSREKSPLREKKKSSQVAVIPREDASSAAEAQKLESGEKRGAWPGPGEGDVKGSKTGPGQGEGEGAGTGQKSGTGPGKGPGGVGALGTGGEGSGGEGDRILGMIRAKILRAKRYPHDARQQGIEGICGVLFAINPDGSLKLVRLMESSGFAVLDQEALATVERAAPFPYYSSPIRFKLRFSLKDR
jgi:TonB family protein